jgi:trehalose 6-phosphate phosphatase
MREAAEAVEWLAERPRQLALFTDFDGTLSPIVAHPELARPLTGVPELLKRLAKRLCVVGVVSGRPAAWLVEQLRLVPTSGASEGVVDAYGLHGLEHTTGGGVEVAAEAAAWQERAARARDEAVAAAIPGLNVEDKTYGVTLHWRAATDPRSVSEQATRLADRLSASTGLLPRPGKASVELVAPIGIDKGTVVATRGTAEGIERVAFFGDDRSDVAAFVAIDELRRRGAAAGLKIAVTGPEAPDELLDLADLVLATPAEAVALLVSLADRLETG